MTLVRALLYYALMTICDKFEVLLIFPLFYFFFFRALTTNDLNQTLYLPAQVVSQVKHSHTFTRSSRPTGKAQSHNYPLKSSPRLSTVTHLPAQVVPQVEQSHTFTRWSRPQSYIYPHTSATVTHLPAQVVHIHTFTRSSRPQSHIYPHKSPPG